ncbi:LamG-like jellyroll fold domain-containing protein [Planctomycetota bacterium]
MSRCKKAFLSVCFVSLCLLVAPASAALVMHFDMEQGTTPLVDLASGITAEAVDDGHLYSLEGPEGFGLAAGLEDNGAWRLDEDESKIFREFANDFSVAAWIYLDSDTLEDKFELGELNGTLNRFFGDDIDWDADGWGMGVFEDGRVRFTKNGVIDLDTDDIWVEADEWYHLAATVSSEDGVTIYVNGEVAQVFDDTRDLNNGTGNNGEDDVYGIGRTYDSGQGQWVAGRFDEIRVYDNVLTEDEVVQLMVPGGGNVVRGDFDGDGQLTAADINLLTAESIAMTNDVKFDLTGDDVVNQDDRTAWVEDASNTYFGDSNLDGEFSSSDFVTVFGAGEYEDAVDGNSTWETGDWNGDGDFNSSDFVTAFSSGGYEKGPRAAQAVPEPSSIAILLIGLFAVVTHGRRN